MLLGQELTSGNISRVRVGLYSTASTGTAYFDDVVVDSGGYPGGNQIARATPNGAGDVSQFLVNVGGTAGVTNNYTRVDETTPDGTTSYNASAVLDATDFFTVSVPSIPLGSTINYVVVGGQYANTTGADATAAFRWQIKASSGGEIAQSAPIIPNSTSMVVNGDSNSPSQYNFINYTDPTGAAWTTTSVTNMQIGYVIEATNLDPIAISTVWALINYTAPGSTTTSTSSSTSTSTTTSISTSSTSSSTSQSTSTSISSTSSSTSTSQSSTSSSTSTSQSSTSSSTSISTSSTSSSTSISTSTSQSSTSSSTSTSQSSTSSSTSQSSTSSSTSHSTSTSVSSTSISTSSSTSFSHSTSSTSSSTSTSHSTSSTSSSTSFSSTTSFSTSTSTSTSTSSSTSQSSTSSSVSSTSSSTSTSTTLIDFGFIPRVTTNWRLR